jgi:hypothetical protein
MSRRLAFILSAFIFCFQEKPWWRAVRFISLHFQLWWKALPTLREDFCFPLWGKTFYFTLPTLMEGASYSEGGLLLPALREDFLFYTSNSDGRRLLLWRRTFASHSEGRLFIFHFQLWWKAPPTLKEDFCFPLWGKTFYFTLPTLMEGASYSEGGLLLPTLREDFYFTLPTLMEG